MTGRDTSQTEASMIFNYMLWEHAVLAGVLLVLCLLKAGERYSALSILGHTAPKRTLQSPFRGILIDLNLFQFTGILVKGIIVIGIIIIVKVIGTINTYRLEVFQPVL